MSATASLPAPLHVKRGHIVVAVAIAVVAIVAVATTLVIRANDDTSSTTSEGAPDQPADRFDDHADGHQLRLDEGSRLAEIVSTINRTRTT